jgi:hypothetical protein
MFERFLNVFDILFEQFGKNRQIFISEAYFIDVIILLAKNSHQFIYVSQYKWVFILANQWFLLEGTIQVVGP